MKVIVFGASNQIGATLVPDLLQKGYTVQACSRRPRPPWIKPGEHLEWIEHDLADPEGGMRSNASILLFMAPLAYFETALKACPEVDTVVAFSSTSRISKIDSPLAAERELAESLARGEQQVRQCCDEAGIRFTLLLPTIIYGAGLDRSLTRIARLLRRFRGLPLPAPGAGKRQPVHVDDLSMAAISAMDSLHAAGQSYVLPGGETLSYRTMVERIANSLNINPWIVTVPAGLVNLVLPLIRLLPRFRDLTATLIARMDQDLVFDASAARSDLDYRPRSFQPDRHCWIRPDQRRLSGSTDGDRR